MPPCWSARVDCAVCLALLQFKTYKIVYRRYAGLFFSVGIDVSDNELTALEAIHLFVEILDHYFSNVCELDLVFNFHKVGTAWRSAAPWWPIITTKLCSRYVMCCCE